MLGNEDGSEQEESEYDKLRREMGAQSTQKLGGSDYLSSKIPQNKAAETLRLGLQSGLPLDTVFRNLEQTKQDQTRLPAGEYERLRREAPATANFASDPYKLSAGREDLQLIEQIEKLSKQIATPTYKPISDFEAIKIIFPEAKRRAAEDFAKQVDDPMDPAMQFEVSGLRSGKRTLAEIEDEYGNQLLSEFRRNEKFMSGDTSKTSFLDRAAAAMSTGIKYGQTQRDLAGLGGLTAVYGKTPERKQQMDRLEKELAITPKGTDFASSWLFPVAKQIGQYTASFDKVGERALQGSMFGMGTTAMGGPVPAGAAATGGAAIGAKFGMAEEALITEGGLAYAELDRITGPNGEKLDENIKRAAATVIGSVNAGLEMVGFSFLAAPFKASARALATKAIKDAVLVPSVQKALLTASKQLGKSVLAETATESLQEGINVLGEEAAKAFSNGEFEGAKANEVVERLVGVTAEAFKTSLLLGIPGPTLNLAASRQKALHTQDALKEIDKAVKQTKLMESNPQEVAKIIEEAAQDQNLYVQAGTYAEFLQSSGIDPVNRLVELTGSGEQMAKAIEAGGDATIQIPLSKYALMDEKERAFFQNEATRDPSEMNARETEEIVKLMEDIQKQEEKARVKAEKTAEQKAKDDMMAAGAARVREAIERAVGEAGFKREAKTYGQFIEAAFLRFGQRAGIDPFELFKDYGLEITRQDVPQQTGEAQFEQPAYHGTGNEKPYDRFDINKVGGEGGEGAQVYGWGIYLAGNKKTGQFYRESLSDHRLAPGIAQKYLELTGGDKQKAIERLRKDAEAAGSSGQQYDDAAKFLETGKHNPGRLYTLDIPDDGAYLDLDKTYDEQPDVVKAALKKLGINDGGKEITQKNFPNEYKLTGGGSIVRSDNSNFGFLLMPASGGPGFSLSWKDILNLIGKDGTGSRIYSALSSKLGGDKAASLALREAGIPGLMYLDQGSRAAGSGSHNYVLFDDKLINIKSYEQPNEGKPARGRIRIGKNREMSIDLFEGKDRSTFLHEVGHFYLETLGDLAERVGSTGEIREDYQAVLSWLGVKNRSEIKTEHHEKWAKGFEQYLMEGKAPSKELRKAFARFRDWLTAIYREMQDYFKDVNLTDDVRKVMDRLLASEEQIDAAQAEQAAVALIPDVAKAVQDGILTMEQGVKYADAIKASQEAVRDRYMKRVMADVLREDQKWWKDEREKMRPEVAAEIDQRKEYRALALMQDGKKPDGSPLDEGVEQFKLSKAAVKKMLPDGTKLPPGVMDSAFPAGLGVDPAFAAGVLGYDTPTDLFNALETAALQPREDAINQELDFRMQKLHGEPMTQQEAKLEAEAALHGEDRSKILRMELEFLASEKLSTLKGLTRALTKRMPSQEKIRADARRAIGRLNVEALVPTMWAMAERRAAKEAVALLTKGDISGAFDAKVRELINHERYLAARDARDTVKNKLRDYRKFNKNDATLAKSRDVDLINAARAILAQYEIGNYDKRAGTFLKQLAAYDPDVFQAVNGLVEQATDNADHYKKITFDQFTEMATAVDSLWDLAKNTRTMEIEGKKVDLEEVRSALTARLKELGQKYKKLGDNEALSKLDDVKIGLLGIKAALRRVEAWADAMGAPFKKYIWRPISDAVTEYREQRIKRIRQYLEIAKKAKDAFDTKPIEARFGDKVYLFKNKAELLGALLHRGNESNLTKLLVGRGWGEVDGGGNLDASKWRAFEKRMWDEGILTKADYDFVQSIWDMFEEIKPQAQRAHKEMFGHFFKEITHDSFHTPWGEYQGGYVPAKADTDLNSKAAMRAEKALEQGFNAGYTFPSTYMGFTQARAAGHNKPLTMDLRMIPQHIDEVLRFSFIKPRVNELLRVLKNEEFASELDGHDPKAITGMLVPWLDRTVKQKTEQSIGERHVDWILRAIRRNSGMQFMFANVANALQNFTGLSVALTKVKAKHLTPAVWRYISSRKQTTADVMKKSAFMRHLLDVQVQDMLKDVEEITTNPNTFQKVKNFTDRHGQFIQKAIQNPVNIATWAGAYDQAIASDKNITERDAVEAADEAVRLTQGAFGAEHMARYEAGNTFSKLFTMFGSYFSMKANLLGTEFSKAANNETGFRGKSGRMLFVYLVGLAIPAILAKAISKSVRGQWDGEDDDGYLNDLMEVLFLSQAQEVAAMAPVAGQVVNATLNKFNDNYFDDRVTVSPVIPAIESLIKTVTLDGSVRDSMTAIGLVTGMPIGGLAKPTKLVVDSLGE
jgi:hypothetical protein